MIVAITGSTGVVGRRLVVHHLQAGDAVRVLSRRASASMPESVQTHRGDLTSDQNVLDQFAEGADVLYHCAAEIHDPNRMLEVNVEGTRNLIAAARHNVRSWVQLSSVAVYGTPERGVITEDTTPQPADVYGRSKAEADRLVMEAADTGCFNCSVLRLAKVFGAGIDSANNQILYRLISLVDRGFFFFISEPGALTHYVHVDNVIEALVRCGRPHAAKHRVYNLSDDCTIEEFVGIIASTLRKPTPTFRLPEAPVRFLARLFGRIPGFPLDERRVTALVNRAAFPCDRLQGELAYTHRVPVAQGLRELVNSWRRHA